MKTLLINWNARRVLRLVLGIVVVAQGVDQGEALYSLLGGMLVLMAMANTGCCGADGCTVDTKKTTATEEKEIVYEEVDCTK